MNPRSKNVTPEVAAKIEAAKKRKEELRVVAKNIAALSDEEKRELSKLVSITTVEGKSLSLNNTCLLMAQSKTATIVGGFNQWRKQGRCVKKGEKALYIWCPANVTKDKAGNPVDPNDPMSLYFVLGAVFDIAQTQELDATAPVEVEEAA